MKRTEIRRNTPLKRGPGPERKAPLRRTGFGVRGDRKPLSRGKGMAASTAQRVKVRDLRCVVCGEERPDPHHLIPRSLTTVGQEETLAVVPLCRRCHDAHHRQGLDLLRFLEPRWRAELAFAVQRVGMVDTFRQVTGEDWEGVA